MLLQSRHLATMAAVSAAAALLAFLHVRRRRRLAHASWPAQAFEPFTLLLTLAGAAPALRSGVQAAQVRVDFSPAHDRTAHAHDDEIDATWNRRLAAAKASGGKLFDMSKFRLHRIGWSGRGGEELCIELGLTSYKEYVGTNQAPSERRVALEVDGVAACGDCTAHLSNALGVETLLLTSDKKVVLLRRSAKVSGHIGLYNGPSGHAEPSHAGLDGELFRPTGLAASGLACAELFGSVKQEVHEETNVPLDALTEPRLIGAMADSSHKPDLLFVTTTTLDAAGVRAAYARGATEGWESDKLAFWPADDLAACPRALPLTPVTRAALECYAVAQEPLLRARATGATAP